VHRFQTDLGFTQSPVQWVPGALYAGYSGRGMNLNAHQLVMKSKMVELHLHTPTYVHGKQTEGKLCFIYHTHSAQREWRVAYGLYNTQETPQTALTTLMLCYVILC
jgi:hypothetical protein